VRRLAHFLLYPSGEDRYLIWAYVVAGVSLITCIGWGSGAQTDEKFSDLYLTLGYPR
jgi:hypothetical protein